MALLKNSIQFFNYFKGQPAYFVWKAIAYSFDVKTERARP